MKVKIITETGLAADETSSELINDVYMKIGSSDRKDGFINRLGFDASWCWSNPNDADFHIEVEREYFSYGEIDKLVKRVQRIITRCIKRNGIKDNSCVRYEVINT